MASVIIYATTGDSPESLIVIPGPRQVPITFPQAVGTNPFRIANTGISATPDIPAKFEAQSNLIITAARLDFPGAAGLRPAVSPAFASAARAFCEFGTKLISLSFNNFFAWQPCKIIVSPGSAIGPNLEPTWNGQPGPGGRVQVEYDSLNMQAIYAGAEFMAVLSLEVETAGSPIL